nr:uncharacterized protein LOC113810846 isoform X1 [Penaeus vannamei]
MVMIIISKVVARIQQLQEKQKYIKELNMSQEQPISIPMANLRYDRDDRYCTKQVVVKLFVLGLLLLAVSLAGFVASQSSCRYNDCTFETHAAFSVGVAALTAGVIFILLALAGHCNRCCSKTN